MARCVLKALSPKGTLRPNRPELCTESPRLGEIRRYQYIIERDLYAIDLQDMWSSDGDELSSMGGSSSIGGSSSHGMTGSMGGISANETDIRQATYTLMDPADWQNAGSTSHLVVPNSCEIR